jgi:hypothetical protein
VKTPTLILPDKHTLGDSWGLGWIRFEWGGRRLIGHDGTTIGQNAYLRLLPSHGLAVTLLTNGGHSQDLYQDLYIDGRSASADLFARAALIAQRLGRPPLAGVAVGGASDGNFTAGVGTPTLDGLGAVGGGAHADDEHVLVAELKPRTEPVRALLADLLAGPPTSDATKAAAAAGTDGP